MSEDMNKELETEVKAEEPVETMEDYAAELEASYAALDQRRDMPEDDSAEGQKWAEFAQMMEDKTVLKVKISEAVKGGVVAFVDEVRAFIPASQLSADYVEKLEDWQGKHVEAVIITVDPEKKRLVLSGRQVERQKREEARKERLAQFKPGDVVEGTVDSLKDYGAFVKLAEGVDGLVHNLDVIKTADYIIDMGPEGGDRGGTVIAKGTPEEVARVKKSYTGQYVKKYL